MLNGIRDVVRTALVLHQQFVRTKAKSVEEAIMEAIRHYDEVESVFDKIRPSHVTVALQELHKMGLVSFVYNEREEQVDRVLYIDPNGVPTRAQVLSMSVEERAMYLGNLLRNSGDSRIDPLTGVIVNVSKVIRSLFIPPLTQERTGPIPAAPSGDQIKRFLHEMVTHGQLRFEHNIHALEMDNDARRNALEGRLSDMRERREELEETLGRHDAAMKDVQKTLESLSD